MPSETIFSSRDMYHHIIPRFILRQFNIVDVRLEQR